MGAELSACQNANRAPAVKNSQVLEFHSSAKWKSHFEASKETSKLVTLNFCFPLNALIVYYFGMELSFPFTVNACVGVHDASH